MWSILIAVALTAMILLSALTMIVWIVLRTVEQSAAVLQKTLFPSNSEQPEMQPDLFDPNWKLGNNELPIPPWTAESEPSR